MMNAFLLHQILKRLVVEFLPVVRLEIDGFSTSFQDLGHGFRHRLPVLLFKGWTQACLENTSTTVKR